MPALRSGGSTRCLHGSRAVRPQTSDVARFEVPVGCANSAEPQPAGSSCYLTPRQAPNCNAFAERFVLSIKSECLGRRIYFGESSLRRVVSEFVVHYHEERAHQGLGNERIRPVGAVGHGGVVCDERLLSTNPVVS